MLRRSQLEAVLALAAFLIPGAPALFALDPHKALTQYTRTVWTQAEGLPQDTISAIAQTPDGYLWVGTDDGLTRFDGYDFTTFTKDSSSLPSNSIRALAAANDGTLWIGTPDGLASYRNRRFQTFTTKNGLPDNFITSIYEDHNGTLWIGAGVYLSRFQDGKFTNYSPERLLPVQAARIIYEDRQHTLWVGGVGGLVKLDHGSFVPVLDPKEMDGAVATALIKDRNNGLWIGGNKGLILRTPDGKLKRFDSRDGLPDNLVRALLEDKDGNLWVSTNDGLSRLQGGRFVASALEGGQHQDWVRCMFEDREGDLWVGMNDGLNRFRDDRFTIYGRAEGWPSDEPIAVHQDRRQRVWVGYHDDGLVAFQDGKIRVYTTQDGLSSNEVFSIRESRNGDLLVSTRGGLSRMHGGRFSNSVPPDPLARKVVFDTLEDRRGRVWVAAPGGVYEMIGQKFRNVVPGGPLLNGSAVVLSEARDGGIWAGIYGEGLWRIQNDKTRRFTRSDGLGSDEIRSLYQDPDGTLWIGTLGGGLNALRDGVFTHYTARDGLLSDNISDIDDDGQGALWLSTTRGLCRIAKQQLHDFSARRIRTLTPVNYGLQDGLRSAQCAPGFPVGGGGTKTDDGRLWFPTGRGLAVIDPRAVSQKQGAQAPIVGLVEVNVDGQDIDFSRAAQLKPGPGHIQFRYTGIHLSAPERVRYEYKLEGLDRDWILASTRRVINYNSLPHGRYRFMVRATVPGQPAGEAWFNLEVLPHFYEKGYFLWLCVASLLAGLYGLYQLRLRQIRGRFSLVLDERARMAREIHDTLAQGFVGISSQLDTVAMKMDGKDRAAQQHLQLAQKMTRYSLTEARRSVMDLRASALDHQDLPSALATAARQWTAGSGIPVNIDVSGPRRDLREDVEQNMLRIAQEAVTNALKHAGAKGIWIRMRIESRKLELTVRDDGRGFELSDAFQTMGGHFGLLGMRERAQRMGGELELSSEPGSGTQVTVSVPLSSEHSHHRTWRRVLGLVRTPRPVRS